MVCLHSYLFEFVCQSQLPTPFVQKVHIWVYLMLQSEQIKSVLLVAVTLKWEHLSKSTVPREHSVLVHCVGDINFVYLVKASFDFSLYIEYIFSQQVSKHM